MLTLGLGRGGWAGTHAGNFTLALARNFNRCVATEISKVSVRAAQYNAEANGIHNVAVVRMSAEEFSDALLRGKTYVRLTEVDIASHDFDTILVDPPRAGLDADSLAFVARFDKVRGCSTPAPSCWRLALKHRVCAT
jgi:tRNA (uracil-5-)-methyltransferase